MNRRDFLVSTTAAAAASALPIWTQQPAATSNSFPENVLLESPYVEHDPIDGYHNAPAPAYEAFQDIKFGARIHWGIYSIWHRGNESWPYLKMSMEDR
jgi:hypothetical protein